MAGAKSLSAADWPEYLGGPDRCHYSPLVQIDSKNVGKLCVNWQYHTGIFGENQCNPIIVGDVLYGVTAANGIFALDAATGHERWRYTALAGDAPHVLRGVTYWSDGKEKRILFTQESWLCALDAESGQLVPSFGNAGKVSLREGLGKSAQNKWVASTTPGTLFGNLLVMPTRVTETADAAPGYIQAFDARTGKLVWTFKTIPFPGEPGYGTWPKNAYKNINVGSANSWAGMAVDRVRGILFVPTGSASPDVWGGDRIGDNLYANCLLAIDVATGKLLWHFQAVHHDLWDRDFPSPPALVTVVHNGHKTDAVAQTTKYGGVLVFDRVTGHPLFPIHELTVPPSELIGELASPSQPFPQYPLPFARQSLTEDDISKFADNRDELIAKFREARKGRFQPFGKYDTILFPGFDGGAEWGGPAVDPGGVMYVNANEMAWVARLKDAKQDDLLDLSPGHRTYSNYCSSCHGQDRLGNPKSGIPSLIDLQTRDRRDAVTKLIGTGKGMMPGFTALTASDLQQLVDFLFGSEKVEDSGQVLVRPVEVDRAYVPYKLDGYVKFLDNKGYPGITPPWGTLTAIDLNTGEQLWRVTLGEFKGTWLTWA